MKKMLFMSWLGLVSLGWGQWVEDSIPVSARFVGDLIYNPQANVVYGSGYNPSSFFVLDCDSNRVVRTIDLYNPSRIAYDRQDRKGYCLFGPSNDRTLQVFDGRTHEPLRTIYLGEFNEAMVWDSVSNQVFVAQVMNHRLFVVHCVWDIVHDTIRVGSEPHVLALNPRRGKLYVGNNFRPRLAIVDVRSNEVVAEVDDPMVPVCACYCSALDRLYYGGSSAVFGVDGWIDTIVARTTAPGYQTVHALVVSETARRLIAGCDRQVFVIDIDTDSVLYTHEIPGPVTAMLLSRRSDQVYCATEADTVLVLAGDGSAVRKRLAVAESPISLEQSPASGRVYVGHSFSQYVSVIRDTVTGLAEEGLRARAWPVSPTICRGVLFLPPVSSGGQGGASLLDITGRQVMDLDPGPNDVRHVASGVYFVARESALRRVVVQR